MVVLDGHFEGFQNVYSMQQAVSRLEYGDTGLMVDGEMDGG